MIGGSKERYKTRPKREWGVVLLGLLMATPEQAAHAQPPGNSISVAGRNGERIAVHNFMQDPSTLKEPYGAEGYYVLEGNSIQAPFAEDYTASDGSFGISLNRRPVGRTRHQAEDALMRHLGIERSNRNIMCRLNYRVAVGPGVDPRYNGRNLGFSFCPGATVLPAE